MSIKGLHEDFPGKDVLRELHQQNLPKKASSTFFLLPSVPFPSPVIWSPSSSPATPFPKQCLSPLASTLPSGSLPTFSKSLYLLLRGHFHLFSLYLSSCMLSPLVNTLVRTGLVNFIEVNNFALRFPSTKQRRKMKSSVNWTPSSPKATVLDLISRLLLVQ